MEPVFEVDLPSVRADIVSDGSIRSGDKGGDLNLQGSVQGNLAFRDGQLSGEAEDLSPNAVARGAMAAGPLGPQGAATQLQLSGRGSLRTDTDGKVYFRSAEGAESIPDAMIREAHGGEISLSGRVSMLLRLGSARRISRRGYSRTSLWCLGNTGPR